MLTPSLSPLLTGASLACWQTASPGPPLVFLHGVFRDHQDFWPILPGLAERFSLYCLDHRGHGRSSHLSPYHVIDYARDAAEWVRTYTPDRCVLYGHSLGAVSACVAAAENPDRVDALILEDPPFDTLGPAIRGSVFDVQFRGMQAALSEIGPGDDRDGTLALAGRLAAIELPTAAGGTVRLGEVRDRAQLAYGARCLRLLDPAVFEPLLAGAWMDGYDTEAILSSIRCPTLLLVGEVARGGMLPPGLADSTVRLIPDCTRVDLEGGHLLHWTHTAQVLGVVQAFLSSL